MNSEMQGKETLFGSRESIFKSLGVGSRNSVIEIRVLE